MSDIVVINGNEYKKGDIVKSEYYYKDEFNDLVLNGFTVKAGDTWLTRDKKKVKIMALSSSSTWPIIGNDYIVSYSTLGIRNADYSISDDDLETKFVEDECVEPADGEPVQEELKPVTKKTKPVKKKTASEDIEELPDLDIQIGDVWLTKGGNKLEIVEYSEDGFGGVGSPFIWKVINGDIYNAKGKYFSLLTDSNKDLVTRVSRVTKMPASGCDIGHTDDTSAVSACIPSECTDMGLDESSAKEEDATLAFDIIDTANCECNFEYEFNNTIRRLIAILSDKIKERALNRDLVAVKDLTKKLEKVIALEIV